MADLQARERQLKERLTVLEGRLHRIEKHLEQPADKDWEENATASEMDEVLDELGHAGNAEVQAIYAALERLKYGTYGNCARCGEKISDRAARRPATYAVVQDLRTRSHTETVRTSASKLRTAKMDLHHGPNARRHLHSGVTLLDMVACSA